MVVPKHTAGNFILRKKPKKDICKKSSKKLQYGKNITTCAFPMKLDDNGRKQQQQIHAVAWATRKVEKGTHQTACALPLWWQSLMGSSTVKGHFCAIHTSRNNVHSGITWKKWLRCLIYNFFKLMWYRINKITLNLLKTILRSGNWRKNVNVNILHHL